MLFLTGGSEWDRKIRCEQLIRKVRIPENTTEERILLWKRFLGEELFPEGLNLEYLADKYRLPAGHIRNSVQEYEDRLLLEQSEPDERYLLEACRAQLEHKLGKDAVRIPVHYRWEDLVLPDPQKSCFGTPAIRCGFIIRCIIAGALNRSWPMEEACL